MANLDRLLLRPGTVFPNGEAPCPPAPVADAAPHAIGSITLQRVVIPAHGTLLAGNLYRPADRRAGERIASVVVVHNGGGVKEQTAGIYARGLAKAGFMTIAFDASHQGESTGEPRLVELPEERTEDIRSVVDWLSNRPDADPDRIGVLGICAGGGYAVHAAETDVRIRAVATVSAVDSGRTRREGIGGRMTKELRNEVLRMVARARTAEAAGGPVKWIGYVAEPEDLPPGTPDRTLAKEAADYCRTRRGMHPNSPNCYRLTSLDRMFAFTAFDHVDWISPRQTLFIAGSDADTRYLSEDAYRMAEEPKELFIIPGATHIDLYDREAFVAKALQKLGQFFSSGLAEREAAGSFLSPFAPRTFSSVNERSITSGSAETY